MYIGLSNQKRGKWETGSDVVGVGSLGGNQLSAVSYELSAIRLSGSLPTSEFWLLASDFWLLTSGFWLLTSDFRLLSPPFPKRNKITPQLGDNFLLDTLLKFTGWPLPIVQIALVGAWLLLIGGLAEGLYLAKAVSSEITRKIVHIGAGNVILLAWWLQTPAWMGITASVIFSLVALLSYWLPILPGINSVGRTSLGTFFYAVSIGVLTAAFWGQGHPEFTALGILTMTWGDGMAALVGQSLGRHSYQVWDMQKSWEGTSAMLLVSFLAGLGVLSAVHGWSGSITAIAFTAALCATGLESFSKLGIDNLTVPLSSAFLAYGLWLWWG
jgi:phytol kinase